MFIIDDETLKNPVVRDAVFMPTINGERKGFGAVPRDYKLYPKEMFQAPSEMELIEPSEYDARIEEIEKTKSSLRDLCTWPSKDQNGQGYCWSYSTTGAVEFLRAKANLPLVRLSAHALACKVKNFRDEGGWCGLSAKFHRDYGCPSEEKWPAKSMSRQYDNTETWENAKLHVVTEDWVDLTRDVYDQNLTLRQIDTCSLLGIPMAWDFNWWGHSVFGCGLVKIEAGSYGRLMRNSWSDSWGEQGWSVLRGSKAIPDGAVALRVTGASVN